MFDPQNILGIICILKASKNYTNNFSDSPFGPDYCTSSKASLTATSNQPYIQCIFKICQTFANFFTFCKTDVFQLKKDNI